MAIETRFIKILNETASKLFRRMKHKARSWKDLIRDRDQELKLRFQIDIANDLFALFP